MKVRPGSNKQSGTSLVDVIMAIGLIGIMAVGIVGSITYGFFTMGLTRENQRATQLLLETVETIRLYNWSQVNSNGFIPRTFTGVYDPQAPVAQQGISYYGTIAITNVNLGASINSSMVQMNVLLTWTNRGLAHQRTVTTYVAKDGIQNYVY